MQKRFLFVGLMFCLVMLALILTSVSANSWQAPTFAVELPMAKVTNDTQPAVKIAVVVDQTFSTLGTGVPQIHLADLEPLIALLTVRGGELAVGVVAPNSDIPLLRWHIPTPVPQPVDSSRLETNLFRVGQAQVRHERAMSIYNETEFQRQLHVDEIIRAMRLKLDSLLSLPPAAVVSDVAGIIEHVDECLSEPDTEWEIQPLKYALFCTDGLHNSGRAAPLAMRSRAQILTVSGGTLGILAPFNPIEFENPRAAVRFIVADAKRTGANQTASAER